MNGRYRFLLADRRALWRELLTAHLEELDCTASVEAVDDHARALGSLESKMFDVVIARCEPSGLDGLSLAFEIRRRKLGTRLVLIGHSSAPHMEVLRAIQAGALGYLAHSDGLAELSLAIEAVLRNNLYVSAPTLRDRSLMEVVFEARDLPPSPFERFSTREREVLHMICEGLSSPRISAALSISPHTVDGHRSALMIKTGSHTTADLLRWVRFAEESQLDHARAFVEELSVEAVAKSAQRRLATESLRECRTA